MNDSLRIAVVAACPFPAPRGTPIRILRLTEALARRGHEVHVVTYHLGDALENAPFQIHRTREVKSYRQTAPGPTYRKLFLLDPLLAGALERFLGSHAIDLIYAHHFEGLMVASWALRRRRRSRCAGGSAGACPIIYEAHTTLESELPSYNLGLPAGFKRRIGRFLDARLPGLADHTVAVSERIHEHLVRACRLSPGAVTVVWSGVEAAAFDVPAADRWRGEPGTRTVIFTGNLARYQGVDYLLRAFASVYRRRPDARLLIVAGSSFDPFERLARELGIRPAVILRQDGFDRLPALLAGADVAVNPRLDCPGAPLKLFNYMAAGKPVVSFTGSAAFLEHDRNGLCVESGDCEAMAAAILRLLDDAELAKRLGEAARRESRERFTWEAAAARVEEVCRTVLGRRVAL